MSKLVEEVILKVKMDSSIAERNISSSNDKFMSLDKSLVKITATIAGVIASMKGLSKASDTSMQFDRIADTMTLAFGSAQKAREEFSFLENVTETLGLRLDTTAEAYSKLAFATKGTKIEGEETRKLMVGLSMASTSLGLSADNTTGILKAFEQMISKGKIQAEELRGQLGDRLNGSLNIVARSLGITAGKLNDMLENGELLAEEVIPKLSRQLQKEFGESAFDKANGSMANMNRILNDITEGFRAVGVVANSGLSPLVGVVDSAVKMFKSLLLSTLEYSKDVLPEFLTVLSGIWQGLSTIFTSAGIAIITVFDYIASGWNMLFDSVLGNNWMEEITLSLTVMAKNFPDILAIMYTKIASMTAKAISGLIGAWKEAQYEIASTALALQTMLPESFGGISDDTMESAIDMLNQEKIANDKIPNWADKLSNDLDEYNNDLKNILGDSYNQEKDAYEKRKGDIKGEIDKIKSKIGDIFSDKKDLKSLKNATGTNGDGDVSKIGKADTRTAYEKGSESANELLQGNKIALDQLEWIKMIEKNTRGSKTAQINVTTRSV